MGSLDDNACWSLLNLHRQRRLSYCFLAESKMYFLVLATAWHSSNWNVTSFLTVSPLCCNILSQFWSIMWDPRHLTAIPSLYLDLMMNPIRDQPITHAYQWRDSATIGHSRFWEELPLKLEHDSNEMNPLSSLLHVFSYFTTRPLSWRSPSGGWSSQHWDWHQRSHLITLQGMWEVSAIKWSGAIK